MAEVIGRLIGMIINIFMIPILLILSIPLAIIKTKQTQKSKLLFTAAEQSLLAKAQRVINMDSAALLKPDRDLLEVAQCIEISRSEYQIKKSRERYDPSFSEYLAFQIEGCRVKNWKNVFDFFELHHLDSPELDELRNRSLRVTEILAALKNYITDYKRQHGILPDHVMLDNNVHMMFAHAGVYSGEENHFGVVKIIPVANIGGGLFWKAGEPLLADDDELF